ncbi:flavin reductase like domain-containing protein [Cladorrhinum sp. PSN332]|nr:flavin reductase like domain-containing protein [Cladorrhinum sp. PSN332]
MRSLRVVAVPESCASSSYGLLLRQRSRHGAWAMMRLPSPTLTPPPPIPTLSRIIPRCSLHTSSLRNQHFRRSPPEPPSISTSPTIPSSSSTASPPLSEQFRSLMRLTPHSVVVCTSSHSQNSKPRAMTMSSFTSLSLHPSPTISFNIATPSRTLDAVESSRLFNIHILSDDAHGARVADWLARGNAKGEGEVFERLKEESGCEVSKAQARNKEESPVLRGDGVLYVLKCKVLDEPVRGLVKIRDHVIVLGEVMEILRGDGGGKETNFGLIYADRTYRRLGECIIPGRIIDAEEEGQEG